MEEHLKESEKKSACPKCNTTFEIDVQCAVSCKGKVSRVFGFGYLQQLKCDNCGTIFPHFRNTSKIEDMNNAIQNNDRLLEEGIHGGVGVGMAQQMLSGLSIDSVTSMLTGILKKK